MQLRKINSVLSINLESIIAIEGQEVVLQGDVRWHLDRQEREDLVKALEQLSQPVKWADGKEISEAVNKLYE